MDTWQNTDINDPAFGHIAIQLNGNSNLADPAATISGPVTALAGSDNIEDCQWHTLNVKWDAATKQLSVYMDCINCKFQGCGIVQERDGTVAKIN
jgi:hypothetical protein